MRTPHHHHSCLFPSGNLSLLLSVMVGSRCSPAVCPHQPLLGWSPWAGEHCPMLSGPQNLIASFPFPAQTTRSPPELLPASWETCGSTPSSTGTSRWYVPIPQPPTASGRIPRASRPEGSSWRATLPKCFPGYGGAPLHTCFSSGVGTSQSRWGGNSVAHQSWSRGAPCA